MLANPAYMGQAAYGKSESMPRNASLRPRRHATETPRHAKSSGRRRPPEQWISIPVPALVSPEIFAAARDQLERNQKLAARNARGARYLLQGLVVCAGCEYAYYGRTVSPSRPREGRSYAYYQCSEKDHVHLGKERACHNRPVRVDALDAYVWGVVRETLEDPARVLQALDLSPEAQAALLPALSQPLPRNSHLACRYGGGSAGCGYLDPPEDPNTVRALYDEGEGAVRLFVARQWIAAEPAAERFHQVSSNAENAFLHQQTLNFSGGRGYQALTARGAGALGVLQRGHALRSDLAEDAHAEARAGERLTEDDLVGQVKRVFVFEQFGKDVLRKLNGLVGGCSGNQLLAALD
jgi:hypothetical protein